MISNTKIIEANSERNIFFLEQALSNVPFYARWKAYDPGSAVPFRQRMTALPVLTKKDLRAHVPHGFIDKRYQYKEGFASGAIEMVSTSGTAGDRVSIVWNQSWWDRSEREAARLHPVLKRIFDSPHREAVLTSPVCAGNLCHVGETPMKDRIVGNLLFLNQSIDPTSWDIANIRRMIEELNLFQPEIVEADPAYLSILSETSLKAGYALFRPQCIVLTYEFPSKIHYRQIGRAFPGVPVISSYGSTETGCVFTQCEAGFFHQNIAACYIDIQPIRAERGGNGTGRILVTTLNNPWSVLIRFDVGDLARLHDDASCPCGCSDGMIVEAIEGRSRDITFCSDGRVVTLKQLDDALEKAEGLIGYQVEQTEAQHYSVRYATEEETDNHTHHALVDILRAVYGRNARIETRRESVLRPEQSGKFRLAYSTWKDQPGEIFQ